MSDFETTVKMIKSEIENNNKYEQEKTVFIDEIRFLEKLLEQYGISNLSMHKCPANDRKFGEGKKETERTMKAPVLMSEEDEENKKVIKKIGERATSIACKVIDTQTSQAMCKKVIKSVDESESFKKLKNSMKEIEALSNIDHPSILSGDWLQFKRETS